MSNFELVMSIYLSKIYRGEKVTWQDACDEVERIKKELGLK